MATRTRTKASLYSQITEDEVYTKLLKPFCRIIDYDAEELHGQNTDLWLQTRNTVNVMKIIDLGIYRSICWGGSNEATILGISPWATALELYQQLRGIPLKSKREMPEESLRLGHKFEVEIAEKFAMETGFKLIRTKRMYQSRKYPWMIGDFDFFAELPDGGIGLLEIKYTDQFNFDFKRIVRQGGSPAYYEAQQRHYMTVTGLPICYLAVGSCEGNLNNYQYINNVVHSYVEFDQDIEDEMIFAGQEFIHQVTHGIEPDLTGVDKSEMALESILRVYGTPEKNKTVVMPKTMATAFEKVLSQKERIAELEEKLKLENKRLDTLMVPIVQSMKDAQTGYCQKDDGTKLVAAFDIKSTTTLDKKAVKGIDENIYEELLKDTGPQRLKKLYPEIYDKCKKVNITQKLRVEKIEPDPK